MELRGKNCVISGAAGGIGFAVCEKYAQNGANVVMLDVNMKALEAAVEKIEAYNVKALPMVVDLASTQEIEKAMDIVDKSFGAVHALANCAGVSLYGDMLEYTEKNWDLSMDINLKGLFFLSQAAAKNMVKHNVKHGKIVSVSSQAGRVGEEGGHAYGASKAGICMVTQTMALDLARYGICCTAIAPGITDTPLFRNYLKDGAEMAGMTEKEFEEMCAGKIPLRRFAKTEEIAELIYFLSSDKANYITGATIDITGGNVNV